MKGEPFVTDDVLARYLAGEASEAEQQQVLQWISESSANKKQFDALALIWGQSAQVAATAAVDEHKAWAKFKDRIAEQPQKKTIAIPRRNNWLKVAAAVLLLAGGSLAVYFMSRQDDKAPIAMAATEKPVSKPQADINKGQPASTTAQVNTVAVGDAMNEQAVTPEQKGSTSQTDATESKAEQKAPTATIAQGTTVTLADESYQPAVVTKQARYDRVKSHTTEKSIGFAANRRQGGGNMNEKYDRTKEFLCNNTPCPLEICIIQSVKCRNGEPIPVSTCSTLEPDQSGQLKYKAFNKIARNCKSTVQEIRITRVSTGETIVLDEHSSPSTAQDFFDYITGQKPGGDIVAGIFHSDCNNHSDDCGLTIDNLGNLILQ